MYIDADLCLVRNGSCVHARRLVFSGNVSYIYTWGLYSEEWKLFFFFFFFFFYESLCCKYSKDTQNSRVIANINVFQLH